MCFWRNVASRVVVVIVGFPKLADFRVSWRFSCTDRVGRLLISEIRGPGPLQIVAMVVGDMRLGARSFVASAVEVSPCVLLIFTRFALFTCTDGHLVVPFGGFRCAGAKLGCG
jgi:hypothetical protein